ncbi:hypothetical protein ACOSQ2_015540 [Xanthoceras sorbifolium]
MEESSAEYSSLEETIFAKICEEIVLDEDEINEATFVESVQPEAANSAGVELSNTDEDFSAKEPQSMDVSVTKSEDVSNSKSDLNVSVEDSMATIEENILNKCMKILSLMLMILMGLMWHPKFLLPLVIVVQRRTKELVLEEPIERGCDLSSKRKVVDSLASHDFSWLCAGDLNESMEILKNMVDMTGLLA